ncbi:MAG: glycosyltransferase, partial [Clostridia bacterium]|nr:glycosyltransferase [Clostridia bacterium]
GKLFAEGYRFDWRIVGDGSERYQIQEWIFQNSLQGTVILEGNSANPFRLVKKADVFALLSEREGLPNTIYEALILGIPVLATNVGGISEQVVNGETGWLIRDDETEIYHAIRHILDHPDEIREIKEKLKTYSYDNTTVCKGILQIFDVHDD